MAGVEPAARFTTQLPSTICVKKESHADPSTRRGGGLKLDPPADSRRATRFDSVLRDDIDHGSRAELVWPVETTATSRCVGDDYKKKEKCPHERITRLLKLMAPHEFKQLLFDNKQTSSEGCIRILVRLALGMSLSRSSLKASLSPKKTCLASFPKGVLWSIQLVRHTDVTRTENRERGGRKHLRP